VSRAVAVPSNLAEYVPLSLLLLYRLESAGAAPILVHGLGVCLVAGRCSHAFGVSRENEQHQYRVAGMALTFPVLLSSAAFVLVSFVGSG